MIDQLSLLRKNNRADMGKLKRTDQAMLEKWMIYTGFSDINPYAREMCLRELIGIARQQESGENSLNHFFGSDPRAVSEKVIQKCPKKSWIDFLVFDVRSVLLVGAGVFFVMLAITRQLFAPISLTVTICAIILAGIYLLFQYLSRRPSIRKRRVFQNLEINEAINRIRIIIFSLLLLLLNLFYFRNPQISIPGIPNVAFPVMCIALWLILTIFRMTYVNKLAGREECWAELAKLCIDIF